MDDNGARQGQNMGAPFPLRGKENPQKAKGWRMGEGMWYQIILCQQYQNPINLRHVSKK